MRVLISAYACEPDRGSEPGVGWNWSLIPARHGHVVHVITRANNRTVIEGSLSPALGDITFHYLDLPQPFLWLKRHTGYYGMLVYYYLWQLASFRLARRLCERIHFDLAHHVTFVNDWMPSGIALLKVPFIWGPVGGSTNVLPKEIERSLPKRTQRYERVRRFTQNLLGRMDPLVGLTRRRADVIITFTETALRGIPTKHRHKARAFIHIGVSESELPSVEGGPPPDECFVVASGSRLVHWKGFDLLIEGFARMVISKGRSARLDITGEGPFRGELETLVRLLGVEDRVRFLGHLPSRDNVYEILSQAHLYALPTLRDGPPVAILEAMAAGKPILCLDHGSTAELVPDGVGLKLALRDRAQVIGEIASTLTWASENTHTLSEMGRRARVHALDVHGWNSIGDRVMHIYDDVVDATRREK